jgi:two-component system OmpR family response regulator
MQNILIVEDEKKVLALIKEGLQHSGRAVEGAESPAAARILMKSKKFDLIILDVMLPGTSGTEFAKEIRSAGWNGFILMLTALSTTSDKIAGLDSGADDYLTKPFHIEELLARLRALVRRAAGHATPALECGDLRLDPRAQRATVAGDPVKLTSHELRLLTYLMHHVGRVVPRSELIEHIYDQDFDRDSNTIEVFVGRLRKKIGQDRISTVRGLGYQLLDPDASSQSGKG